MSQTKAAIEDKAVDLYVLERAMASTHPHSEAVFEACLQTYRFASRKGTLILSKLDQVLLNFFCCNFFYFRLHSTFRFANAVEREICVDEKKKKRKKEVEEGIKFEWYNTKNIYIDELIW